MNFIKRGVYEINSKKMKYNKFLALSVKARTGIVQRALIRLGYQLNITYKMDKITKTCIKNLQKANNIIPNCIICSKTYNLLDIREDDINDKH